MYEKTQEGMRREEKILETSNSSTPLREPYSKPSIGTTLTSIFSSMPLIRVLVRRDLRLRYHSSVLGYLWTLIEPLMLAGAYYLYLSSFVGPQNQCIHYWY